MLVYKKRRNELELSSNKHPKFEPTLIEATISAHELWMLYLWTRKPTFSVASAPTVTGSVSRLFFNRKTKDKMFSKLLKDEVFCLIIVYLHLYVFLWETSY